MSESVKGLSAVALRFPYRIEVAWDQVAHPDFEEVKIVWWCLGAPTTESSGWLRHSSQFFIDADPGKTYVIAAQIHCRPPYPPGSWDYIVIEVPWVEDEPQYTNLGQVTVIDTPRGPAILLDDLRDAFS